MEKKNNLSKDTLKSFLNNMVIPKLQAALYFNAEIVFAEMERINTC